MIVAYSRGAKGPVIDEDAFAFLFNASPSVGVTEGTAGAGEAPRMDAEAFASYILEQFKARVAKSSRRPWEEAKEYYYQLRNALHYKDADFVRTLTETAAYPDKLDFDELMNMWLSLPRRERKKARKLIVYKIMEYGAEEFLRLIAQSERLPVDAELRRTLLRVAQAFINKNIGVFHLTDVLENMFIWASLVQIEDDVEKNVKSFEAGLYIMERSRKDRLRELVKKHIVDELIAIEKKLEEEAEEWKEDLDYEEFGADEDLSGLDEEIEYGDDDDCGCIEEDDYYEDDDP
jgi:hypothetical protein